MWQDFYDAPREEVTASSRHPRLPSETWDGEGGGCGGGDGCGGGRGGKGAGRGVHRTVPRWVEEQCREPPAPRDGHHYSSDREDRQPLAERGISAVDSKDRQCLVDRSPRTSREHRQREGDRMLGDHERWERRGFNSRSHGMELSSDEERISHILGKVLRYHLGHVGLVEDDDGFVMVSDLLGRLEELRGVVEEDIENVVQKSVGAKGRRFELRESLDGLGIRACYRHPSSARDGYSPSEARGNGGRPYGNGVRSGKWNGSWDGGHSHRRSGNDHVSNSRCDRDYEHGGRGQQAYRTSRAREEIPRADDIAHVSNDTYEEATWAIEDSTDVVNNGAAGCVVENVDGRHAPALHGPSPGATPSSAASTTTSASAVTPEGEVWERYVEPRTERVWFWQEATGEMFFADDVDSGWMQYTDKQGRPWWFHEDTGRFFYEAEL